jgi:hypothetical protein
MDVHLQNRYKLIIVLTLLGVSMIFWNSIVLYPIKLFVVLLHEVSHGFAAVATGGSILRIEINERIGGVCYTAGGWPFVVVSAGYVGSMILGGLVFMLAQRASFSRWLAAVIGTLCVVVTLLYVRNLFGLLFGVGFGLAFLASARYLPPNLLEMFLQYVGAMSCLYALVDVKEDLLTLQPRLTDAAILAGMTHIPAIVWGIIWSVLSLCVFLLVLYATYRRHAGARAMEADA